MSGATFAIDPISLAQGWHGRVLTARPVGCEMECDAGTMRSLPAVEEWRPVLEQIIADPSKLPGYSLLKYSRDTEVFCACPRLAGRELPVIGKRSQPDDRLRRWLQALRASRQQRNFDRGLELVAAGVPTALPLAVIERQARRGESWLLTAAVAGLLDLDRICLSELSRLGPDQQRSVRDGLIAALVELVGCLERHGLTHRDLKASNILFSDWDTPHPRAWLTDLDGLSRQGSMSVRGRAHPLVRLAASVLSYSSISRTDYARALRIYLDRGGEASENWKAEFRRLQARAVSYARRAAGRKRYKLDGYNANEPPLQPLERA